MGSDFVVLVEPFGADLPHLVQRVEQEGAEHFLAVRPVESLDVSVLIRLARLDEAQLDVLRQRVSGNLLNHNHICSLLATNRRFTRPEADSRIAALWLSRSVARRLIGTSGCNRRGAHFSASFVTTPCRNSRGSAAPWTSISIVGKACPALERGQLARYSCASLELMTSRRVSESRAADGRSWESLSDRRPDAGAKRRTRGVRVDREVRTHGSSLPFGTVGEAQTTDKQGALRA